MCDRKIRNWRIVAGILVLLLLQAVLGRMDSDARLEEAERLAQRHTSRPGPVEGQVKPPASLQRQAAIGNTCGGVL